MKILVLGSGPAGLMAAQGAVDAANIDPKRTSLTDLKVAIISHKVKSDLYGCQYLHQPIPGITPAAARTVSYQMRGDADDYRRKVYGQVWSGTVSPEDLGGEHQAWDLRATYDALWTFWERHIMAGHVDAVSLSTIVANSKPDLIINSIPRPALCHEGHAFGSTEIWAAGDAPKIGIHLPYQCPKDMVVCNAEDNPSWYRMSNVFGHTTVEWPGSLALVPVRTAARVRKPTSHACTCWEETLPIMHVGRYGEWAKGVLSHTAYFKAYKKIDGMLGGSVASAEAGAPVSEV